MTNHMAEVAKMLGVNLEEEFKVKKGVSPNCFYKLSNEGLFLYKQDKYGRLENRHGERSTNMLSLLLEGIYEVVPLWKPIGRERYYVPSIDKPMLFTCWAWENDELDRYRFERGLVCRTKEDAIELAKKMLAAVFVEQKKMQLNSRRKC